MNQPVLSEKSDERLGNLPIFYRIADRPASQGITVFMPAALGGNREDRSARVYSRFSWYDICPNDTVIAFCDPALTQDEQLNGAWFIHPEHDILEAMAAIVADIAAEKGIPAEKIKFYGSSLGGFGAIAAAAHLKGSHAIAEVPQIDFGNWLDSAIDHVEKFITKMPIEEYRKLQPHQLSVVSRIRKLGIIPRITMITNPEDLMYGEQRWFFDWVRSSRLPKVGEFDVLETSLTKGHQIIPKEKVQQILKGLS